MDWWIDIVVLFCIELAHSSLGDRGDTFINNLINIIKSEVAIALLSYFAGCVPDMVVS